MNKFNTKDLMNEYFASNLSVQDFCKSKGICTSTFYKHKRTYNSNEFIDVTHLASSPFVSSITININNVSIIVNKDTDFVLLRKVIRELSL